MQSFDLKSVSKFLSNVFRPQPDSIGLVLDREEWADIDEMVSKAAASGKTINRELIEDVAAKSDKKRFSIRR